MGTGIKGAALVCFSKRYSIIFHVRAVLYLSELFHSFSFYPFIVVFSLAGEWISGEFHQQANILD